MATVAVGMLDVWINSFQGEAGSLVFLFEGAAGRQQGMYSLDLSGFWEDLNRFPHAG